MIATLTPTIAESPPPKLSWETTPSTSGPITIPATIKKKDARNVDLVGENAGGDPECQNECDDCDESHD